MIVERAREFSEEWSSSLHDFEESQHLCDLKSFRDQYVCDSRFRDELMQDLPSVLQRTYPLLTTKDIQAFLPSSFHDQWNLSDRLHELPHRLHTILSLEKQYRSYLKSLKPIHSGWSEWRGLQINRLAAEDSSFRSTQITHIPFAIELTDGCSGGCRFCGVSAPPLKQYHCRFVENQYLFRSLLQQLLEFCGPSAFTGCLYWATDPFDHADYEDYAAVFQSTLGFWPITTTALAEKHVSRLISFLALRESADDRPWGVRCSLRSASAYKALFRQLTPLQRAKLVLIPQYKGALTKQANAGRAFQQLDHDEYEEVGGTIACVSGLLVSLPRQTIDFITPCLAEPNHPNGYRTIMQSNYTVDNLSDNLQKLMNQLPCPAIRVATELTLSIDASQFSLYPFKAFPGILDWMNQQPFSLGSLIDSMPASLPSNQIMSYCLSLIQCGAIRIVDKQRLV